MSSVKDILAVASQHDNPVYKQQIEEVTLWPEIQQIIVNNINSAPRSLQKTIGPSELGTDCVHCLAAKLAGWKQNKSAAWLPFIGTCVHEHFERLFSRLADVRSLDYMVSENGRTFPRFEAEKRVEVATLNASSEPMHIRGSIDLVDYENHATIDWKIVGSTSLRNARANSPSQQYRVQASLYGIGLENEGVKVEKNCIYFLPRTSMNLNDMYAWEVPFDRELGEWALWRAQWILQTLEFIETLFHDTDVRDTWISNLPCSETHCFDCATWPDSGLSAEFNNGERVEVDSTLRALAGLTPAVFDRSYYRKVIQPIFHVEY
ncbi:hypothetical protein ACHEUQ_03145 [Alloscardovia omnicolens]|uniref:hypothetical protein n=1 Tax=Alloscardovia omnicolens TaxID=419015 RepID=UPI0037577A6B